MEQALLTTLYIKGPLNLTRLLYKTWRWLTRMSHNNELECLLARLNGKLDERTIHYIRSRDATQELLDLLAHSFPMGRTAENVRIRWSVKTVHGSHHSLDAIPRREIDESEFLSASEKDTLRRLCGC